MSDPLPSLPPHQPQPPSRLEAIDDCWNRIGVRGDSSCAELKTHIHCRNCPTFGAAGLKLLDRTLAPGYREHWARMLADARSQKPAALHSVLVFRIDHNWLALATGLFQEIADTRRIHSLPHRRHSVVLGLANVRGELLICISLRRALALESGPSRRPPHSAHSRFMVVNWRNSRFVFPVDEVRGMHRYNPADLLPAPQPQEHISFVRGVLTLPDGLWVHCLDETVLMNELSQNLA